MYDKLITETDDIKRISWKIEYSALVFCKHCLIVILYYLVLPLFLSSHSLNSAAARHGSLIATARPKTNIDECSPICVHIKAIIIKI